MPANGRLDLNRRLKGKDKVWCCPFFRGGSTTLKEWTTPDSRNTPSTTNLEEEETVDAPGNDGNASMPEQVKRPNPWGKMMMMMNTKAINTFRGHKAGSLNVDLGGIYSYHYVLKAEICAKEWDRDTVI
jgi:hypothetical protein